MLLDFISVALLRFMTYIISSLELKNLRCLNIKGQESVNANVVKAIASRLDFVFPFKKTSG